MRSMRSVYLQAHPTLDPIGGGTLGKDSHVASMFSQHLFLTIAFLPFFLGTVLAVECTNVTIATADEADEVRKACKTITGYLRFDGSLNETINLDGVETIDGDLLHDGDDFEGWGDMDEPYPIGRPTFKIHSSTLKTVSGYVYFRQFNGLRELAFPNLARVEEEFEIVGMRYLKLLDITKLAHLGSFTLHANHLTTLRHEGLKGFTNTSNRIGLIDFQSARVESIDSWFRYPLTVNRGLGGFLGDREYAPAPISIYGYYLPNVKNVTIGWANISSVKITGDNINVRFGGLETEDTEIDFLMLEGNITKIERGSNLKKLEVGELLVTRSFADEVDLSALDQVTNLTIRSNPGLGAVELPSKAVDWEDVDLKIHSNGNLNLTSEYRDPKNEKDRFWYWPERQIRSISIARTPVSNDFFKSFLEYRNGSDAPKVLDSFDLEPSFDVSYFDCTPFDELRNRSVLPKKYNCESIESPASMASPGWSLAIVAFVTSVLWFF